MTLHSGSALQICACKSSWIRGVSYFRLVVDRDTEISDMLRGTEVSSGAP